MPPSGESEFLQLANHMADAARPITLAYFRSNMVIESKSDRSPVTAADRESEAAMRDLIESTFPDHGILGEELGPRNLDAEYLWVLDPIDGTKSFAVGMPVFTILIALLRGGIPILGLMDCPATGERWIGMAGRQTTFNGQGVRTRDCSALETAWLGATSPNMFPAGDFEAFEQLRRKCTHTVWGAHACAYGYLSSGHMDAVCEATMQPYDYLPLVPIVTGAGGVITDWRGEALTLESDGRVLAAGNAEIHRQGLAALAA
jgi:histidinol phosphatase-like enzyme (inositol monophosphatase family)